MRKKCVITVDIKGSRKLLGYQRDIVQKNIFHVLSDVKRKFASELLTAGMTGGDEFQIVVDSPENAVDIFQFLRANLPTELHFGVGVGSIEPFDKSLSPSEMYGTAFYSSREAIDHAKKKQVEIVFRTGDRKLDSQINLTMELVKFIRRKRTKRQKDILRFMESHIELKQKEIAEHFGVSEQAISKIIKASGFELVKQAERLVKILLETLGSD